MKIFKSLFFTLLLFGAFSLQSHEITIAVAANMKTPMEEIRSEYQKISKDTLVTVYGASGQLASQIKNGAPFEIFLSADMRFPESLHQSGFAILPPKAYAIGVLILLGTKKNSKNLELKDLLLSPEIKHIAVANPTSAPYGDAAVQALKYYGIYDTILPKIVFGESVSQVNQFIFSEAADFGFTSKSTLYSESFQKEQTWLQVDSKAHAPILQGATILKSSIGPKKESAEAFYNFLFSDQAKAILKKYGYEIPK